MTDEYVYTVTQAALILNKSDKTIRAYATEGLLRTTKKIEEGSGIEKVFISVKSLAELAELRKIALNFDALEKYTADRNLLESVFQRKQSRDDGERDNPSPVNSEPLALSRSMAAEENLVVAFLREQVGKLEAEKEEMKQDLKEKDRQLEEKNLSLIAVTRENSDRYQLIALAKEQAEARLAKLTEHTHILHLSTNRDIRRLQEGKLQAADLSLLPLPSDISAGDYDPTPPESEGYSATAKAPVEEAAASVTVDLVPPPSPLATVAEPDKPPVKEEVASIPKQPTTKRRERKKKQERASSEKMPPKEAPQKKRGFFRRIFGS